MTQRFSVGDTVRLTGDGWHHYCSTPVSGGEFRVAAVTDKGEAEIPLIPTGDGGFYMAWVSPDPANGLHGVVVDRGTGGVL